MYRISKEFHISASHRLTKVPEGHPCGRLHGHNYVFTLILQSHTLNDQDFVRDYNDLDRFKKWLDDTMDHRDLNETMHPIETTAENIAKYLYDACKKEISELVAVEVKETPKTTATYMP